MTLAQLIPLVMQISMGLIVFSLALRAAEGDLVYLLRRPALLVRSLVSMSVIVPLAAAAVAALFSLRPEVKVALLLLAVSPVPPVLPHSVSKAGGNMSYGIGLLAISSLLAIAVTPASIGLIGLLFGRPVQVPPADIAAAVAISVLGPLLLGALVRRLAPSSVRLARPIALVSGVAVGLAFLAVLVASWYAVVATLGDFTLIAIVLFGVASLLIGHLLGGPEQGDRTVLALATANRHPGVALAIAGTVASDRATASAAVLLAFVVGMLSAGAYTKWSQRNVD